MKLLATAFAILVLGGIGPIGSQEAYAQGKERDPFSLPSGVHLLSKGNGTSPAMETPQKAEVTPVAPKIMAIMISDRFQLALIDRQVLAVGDFLHDEKILQIKKNHVVLGKGDKKRAIYLPQNHPGLIIESNPERR